jgi:RHS repeat-associated protein
MFCDNERPDPMTPTISGPDGTVATVRTQHWECDLSAGACLGPPPSPALSNISGSGTFTTLLLKDHLGSMVAEVAIRGSVDAQGQVVAGSVAIVENSLNVHGFGPWGNARNEGSPLAEGQRGFTGHEHLAELGLIHMNGRIYDPVIGRFLQADPIIQAPHNAQSHNRYSYVMNNPLSFTDPSGFSSWTKFRNKWLRPIIALAAAWFIGPAVANWALAGLTSQAAASGAMFMTYAEIATTTQLAIAGAAGGAAAGFAAGGIMGGNIQSALQGAFAGGLTGGVGMSFGNTWSVSRVAAQAASSAAAAHLTGGDARRSGLFAFAIAALSYGNSVLRESMVESSRRFPNVCSSDGGMCVNNHSGVSGGAFNDFTKIGGGRVDLTSLCGGADGGTMCTKNMDGSWTYNDTAEKFAAQLAEQRSPMGGVQGGQGYFAGVGEYKPFSVQDRIVESFAGPHDALNSRYWYNVVGNANTYTGAAKTFGEVLSYANVVPAAPFAIAVNIETGAVNSVFGRKKK